MSAQKTLTPFSSFKNFLSKNIHSPAYRIILKTANYNRRLILIAFNSNLLASALEAGTFGLIYVALRVLEEGSISNINRLNWLAPYVESWEQGQLFLGLIIIAILIQYLRSGFQYLGGVSAGYLGARIGAQMKDLVFRRIMSLSFSCVSGYKIGDLTKYIGDAQNAVKMEIQLWEQLLVKGLTMLGYLVVLIAISPLLSLVALVLGSGLFLIQRYLIPLIRQNSRELTQAQVGISKQMVETIQGLRLIHSFGRQRQATGIVHHLISHDLLPLQEKQARLSKVTGPVNQALTITVVGLLLIIGFIVLSDEQALVIPALFTFIAALNRLSGILGGFAGLFNQFAQNSGKLERLDEILTTEDKEWSRVGGKTFKGLKDKIEFDNVTLQYFSDQAPALHNINLVMPQGSVTALVGSSGAGKSSIADLLTGLYDPTEGKITIDNVDLKTYSLESWRQQMGVVSQDTFIFNQPIIENIRYGKPEATEDEVIQAAKDAQAHDFIAALPNSYDTIVGERGYRLSGGQRQRVALARAILKQPEVLILDEATSALDSQSERLVQQALAMFQKDRTVLVVAHRLSTITGADQILVLEQGEIIEWGTHQELLTLGERYAQYWQLQAQGEVAVN